MPTDFERFFAGPFQRRLESVKISPADMGSPAEVHQASWDRRAAYLLWVAEGRRGILEFDDSPLDKPAKASEDSADEDETFGY
jgi:hypothetical protein